MGEITRKFIASKKGKQQQQPKDDRDEKQLAPDEANALKKMRREADAVGSFLTSDGKGGLDPSLVLGVMRRDGFKCKVCGEYGDEEQNGGIGVHHKNQHITAPVEKRKGMQANKEGRRNDPNQLTTICESCHDRVHERDREEYGGEDADEAQKK